MANKVAAAALQYSKWLSRFICWVWATHRFIIYILAAIRPEAADALVSSIGQLDTIMLVNEGTYLVNSLGEKWLYSDRYVLSVFKNGWFKSLMAKINHTEKEEKKDDEIFDEENESNG